MQNLLGIENILKSPRLWKSEFLIAMWIPCGFADRRFIEKEPSFLHAHRDHAYCRSVNPGSGNGVLYLSPSQLMSLSFGITMDKHQIAGVRFGGSTNSSGQVTPADRDATRIRPAWYYCEIWRHLVQQPIQ